MNFLSCSKSGQISSKWLGENSSFLLRFLIHIHVIFKVAKKSGQSPCTIVQGH